MDGDKYRVQRVKRRLALAVLALVIAGLIGSAAPAGTAPTNVQLVLNGYHPADGREIHLGTFTASEPFCTSGSWWATGTDLADTKRLTCDDGSGTFAIRSTGDNHVNGNGSWLILSGTGRYLDLRGQGTWTNTIIQDPSVIVRFVNRLQGIADFDAVAPSLKIARVNAIRLGGHRKLCRLSVSVVSRDDVRGNAVSYTASVNGGSLGRASGHIPASGSAAFAVRIRAGSLRSVTLTVTVSDPVGNERTLSRSVRLPKPRAQRK